MSKFAVLIVEDEFLIAAQIESVVSGLDCDIVGPASLPSEALDLIENGEVDAAILDITLRNGEKVYPVADELRRRNIPFTFLTAYGPTGVHADYSDQPVISKPFAERAVRDFIDGVRASA
jgi:two-component SAPR family response regulator